MYGDPKMFSAPVIYLIGHLRYSTKATPIAAIDAAQSAT